MLAHEIKIEKFGAPDVMQIIARELPLLQPHEVLVRQTVIGFNALDISQRNGHIYKLDLPSGLGHEAAGVIEAVGADVSDLEVGDRVAYMNAPIGAYADFRNIPAEKLVKIPENITDIQAATLLFKGLTAQYLLNRTYKVGPNDIILIHAAAGNVSQIMSRWAKHLGAFVIGTVSSEGKRALALEAGCDVVINLAEENWTEQVLKATNGKKANVVYDSIGNDTFLKSLDCTAKFGTVVIYGALSGPAPLVDPELLNTKGCLFLTRPSVFAHNATTKDLRENARQLFDAIASGVVQLEQVTEFKLSEIVEAHKAVEDRKLAGAIVFIP